MPKKRMPRETLRGLFIKANKWSNVADLYKDEVKHCDDDRKIEVYWELINLYRERLRQPGLVVTTLASLEKVLDERGDNEALLKVVETQQAQFEKMKRWPDLIGRIRRRAELTEDPIARTELHLEAGRLYLKKFNNQAEAIKSYEAVLEADEYNVEAITKLKELYQRRRDWEKMVAIQQRELDLIDDPQEQMQKLLEIAQTASKKIKKNSLSIELWNQVLSIEPDNADALSQLQTLYEREKNWKGLSEVLSTMIEIEGDQRKKTQFLVKLGQIYSDRIGDKEAAIRSWRQLYELDPKNRRAADQLKKLYLATGDMDSLEEFYAAQNKWSEFIRVLEREADSSEPEVQVKLLTKIGELYKVRMEKRDRAVRALEKARGVDDNNLIVAEALLELYEEAGDEKHISPPLAIKLNHSEDPDERQELLRRLADLAERVHSDQNQAFDYYRQAFSEEHTAEDVREHIERLTAETGRWTDLVETHEAAIEKYGDAEESIPLRLKVAEVYESQLNELEKALATNQAILEINGEESTAITSLERLYVALGREDDLLNILGTQLSLAETDEDSRAIQTKIGSIHEQAGNHDKAIEAYEAVLATGVEDPQALGALDRMYLGQERYTDLADILRRELVITDDEDAVTRSTFLLRLGVVTQERLEQAPEAVDLYRQVLEIDVDNEDARKRLEGWLEDEELKVTVATILLPVYETREEWPQMVQCLEIQAAAEELTSTRVELLLRAGSILTGQMGDSQKGFDAFSRAFKDDPENETAQAELAKISALDDRYADFAGLYEQALEAEDLATDLTRDLLMKLATLYHQRLENAEKAVDCYRRAVEVDPENMDALTALEELYNAAENWNELLDVYRQKVALTDEPEDRQALRFRIAYLQDEMLKDVAEAINTYNEILADEYENIRALEALDRLYLGSELWIELAENLERQLTLAAEADAMVTLNLRLGEVQLVKLEQAGMAVETYRRVLEIDAGNETAIEALETLLENEEQQLTVAKILEGGYRSSNQWAKLIQAYEIMVKHSEDDVEKIRLLHEIGQLHEIAGDEQKAFEALGRAFRVTPSEEETQHKLDNLARQMGSYTELVALIEDVVPDIMDDDLIIRLLFKVARIHEEILDSAENAAKSYDRVLDVDPTNFPAVDALMELHRRTENWEALVTSVIRKSEMVDNIEDRKKLLLYAADVREKVMEDLPGSINLYQQVLSIDDADEQALEALRNLYTQTENWEELKEIYSRMAELAMDPEDRRSILHVLGQVIDGKLEDVDRAIETYQRILDEIDPGDWDAIQALDRLFAQAERWPDQLSILERAVEVSQDPAIQTERRHRIGKLWEDQLGDLVRAIEAYRDTLHFAHDYAPTYEALDRIVHGEDEPMMAAEVLAPLYEQLAEWEKLVDVYEVMVVQTDDEFGKIERLHMIAAIYERQLQLFDKAFDAFARALEVDATHEESVEQLQRLADVTGEWEKFADLLARMAEDLMDSNVKVSMLLRQAWILEEKLERVDDAIGRYVEVFDTEPEHQDAMLQLDRIFTNLERWGDLVENLRRQITVAEDEDQSIAFQFRMGQIYQFSMQDLPHAIEAYREILNINPDHQQTLSALEVIFEEGEHQTEIAEILEPLYYAAERWESLVKLNEVKFQACEDDGEKLSIIQNVAEICERRLGDVGQAFYWWLRGYQVDPLGEQITEEMERLAEITQEWSYIVDVGDDILKGEEVSDEVKLAVYSRSGRILEVHIQDADRSIAAYREVHALSDENLEALEALDRLYSRQGMAEELADILQKRIQATMETDMLVDLEMRLATTYEQFLANPEEAISAYNRAIEHDPSNGEALNRLEALFLSHYRWEELFDTYQKMVDVANTDEDMAACYQRMAKLAAETLDREIDAVDLWGRVLDLRGEDPLALGELAELHERSERWEDLVEILERKVYAIEDTREKVDVYKKLGRVNAEKLENDRASLDAWLNALDLDDRDVETLQSLHRIYEESESWPELVDILARLIAVGPDVLGTELLRDYYAQVGRIQGEYLMQTDEAIDAWLHVVNLEASNMEALAALENLYSGEARFNEVIQVLERKVKVLSSKEEKIDVLMEVARLWEENLDNKNEAAGVCLEILDLDRSFMAADETVERIYRETEEWGLLIQHLVERAEAFEETEIQVSSLQAAAKVVEFEVGDVDMGFELLKNAFQLDYGNEITSRELERIATQSNKWGQLLSEYNGIVTQIRDPHEQCELWVKIGRWYGEHLNRPDYGIQSLQKALELNSESKNALRELSNFYRRADNAAELASALARIVPLEEDPEQKIATLIDLAQVQDTGLGDAAASIESYCAVLEIDAENITALESLMRLYEVQGEWQNLVSIIGRRSELMDDPDEAIALKKRIGQIQDTALQDPAAAIETYKDIVATDSIDVDALSALERLYLAGNQVPEYLETLEAELDAMPETADQIVIFDKMAKAYVDLSNDAEKATEVLEKILELDPVRDVTYRQLEELYRKLEKWSELVDTQRRHVEALDDNGGKIAILLEMGEVYEGQIQDLDRAIDTYREILELDQRHFDAAMILSNLLERIEDWPSVIETIDQLVDLASDPQVKVEQLTRNGKVQLEKMDDATSAEVPLIKALEIEPGHVPGLVTLAEVYKTRHEWLKAARNLEEAAEYASNKLEKTDLASEAGFIYYEELDNRDKARELFAKVIALDPEHIKAGRVLSDIYFDDEEFEKAEPVFRVLVRNADKLELDDQQRRDLFLRSARVARKLDDGDRALKRFQRAYDIDSTDRDVLVGMADLLFEREEWDRAFKLYQTILVQHRDSQSAEETVQVYFRLGTIKKHQGEGRKALNYLEKALEVEPHDTPTLNTMIELQTKANNWEGVVQAKRALAEVEVDGDKQAAIYKEIGKLYLDKLRNWKKSVAAYEEALDRQPENYPLLHTMLDIFTKNKDWEEAVRIIERIVEIEKNPMRRSRYNYTSAVLLRDEIKAHDEAIERFNAVLDDDPTFLKAFQAIDAMVTKSKDWKTLERSYRKMLKRLPADEQTPLKITLWSNLAEIYRTRLRDYKAAAAAFEVAAKLDPENVDRHFMLAELYETLIEEGRQEFVQHAVREHGILLTREPYRFPSYHALFNIYQRSKQVDKAFCVARTLVFLKQATEAEQALYQQYNTDDFQQARQRLSEETLRRHVFSNEEDLYLTALLGSVALAVSYWRAKPLPASFNPADRIDISLDRTLFSQMAKYVCNVLNVPQPDVYFRNNEPGDLQMLNAHRDQRVYQTMVVFANLLKKGMNQKMLAFALGRHMLDLYLPHWTYVALDRSPQSLKQVFLACMLLCGLPVPPAEKPMLSDIARQLAGRMAPAQQDQLKSLMRKFVDAGGSTDVKKWARAAEIAGYRVGLLLCNDLMIAAHITSQEQGGLGAIMTPKEKVKELVLYSISEDYFKARRSIGLHVG